MKRGIFLLVTLLTTFAIHANAETNKPKSSADQLRKEVSDFFKNKDLTFLENPAEIVNVSFLINPKNELVILDVTGGDSAACDYVRQVLNFQQVKYTQARQLTRYVVDIRLVR